MQRHDCSELLVVDEDADFRLALAKVLSQHGFRVSGTGDPRQATDMARALQPAAVILDITLAGHTSLSLIRPLLASAPTTRVIVVTACVALSMAVDAVKLGASNYLTKPLDTHALLRTLGGPDDQPDRLAPNSVGRMSTRELEGAYLLRALAEHDGNVTATARALRMHRRTLQRKLARHAPA